jgi:hypothetical protein
MLMVRVHDVIYILTFLSMAGVLLGMVAYTLMVLGKIPAAGRLYMGLNLAAAVLVAFSLIDHFNPCTAILQVFYSSVSAYGLWKAITAECPSA